MNDRRFSERRRKRSKLIGNTGRVRWGSTLVPFDEPYEIQIFNRASATWNTVANAKTKSKSLQTAGTWEKKGYRVRVIQTSGDE